MRIIGLILTLVVSLSADLMYEMTTNSEGMIGMSISSHMTVYVKGDCSRTEITRKMPMVGEKTEVSITRFDKGIIWTLDTKNKQYFEEKIGDDSALINAEPEKTTATVPEVKVEKTGKTKEILGVKCEEVIISIIIKSEDGDMNLIQDQWITKDIAGYGEIMKYTSRLGNAGPSASAGMAMNLDQESFVELQNKINGIDGLALEYEIKMTMMNDEMPITSKMHAIMTKIDVKPISDKVFEIPAGYSQGE